MRIAILLLAASCAGDSPPPSGVCTGLDYQPCNEEHDCDSNFCQNFAADEFQVCSQPCDGSSTCPEGGDCDTTVGFCKPAAPLECTL